MTTVLFDIPGPKARVRNLGASVLGGFALLLLIGFVLYRFAVPEQVCGESAPAYA